MKYIKQYENHVKLKKAQEVPVKEVKTLQVINESVEIIDDIYEVRTTTEIPQSLINGFIKKAETNLDIKVRKTYSDKDLAEMLVNKVIKMNLDIEKLNPSDFFGGGQSSSQEGQSQETPTEAPTETPQEDSAEAPQSQPQAQAQSAPTEGYESTEENLPEEQTQTQEQV
jgi:hypothetical protein